MTIAQIAFVPSAPLMVPAVAGGSAGLDHDLRTAALSAVAKLVAGAPPVILVVAPTEAGGEWGGNATWSFAGFGVGATPDAMAATLPWSLGIGAWLLDECGYDGPRRYVGLSADDGDAPNEIPDGAVILAVGDGTACRTEKAPGHLDPRAEAFDERLAEILSAGDVAALLTIEATLARELLCGGLPVWRWVARAAADAVVRDAVLVSHVAPYGVGYFVASWSFG